MSIFTDLLTKNGTRIPPTKVADARRWYMSKARNLNIDNVNSEVILKAEDRVKSPSGAGQRFIGSMVLFQYHATWDKHLPYWDRFPLVFPFRVTGDGFYGINFHYLPPRHRALLLDSLYKYIKDDNINDTQRLKLSYSLLMSASRANFIKPCVKHYLNKGMRSQFAIVPSDEWEPTLFLPVEDFQKAKSNEVYQDSLRKIRGS